MGQLAADFRELVVAPTLRAINAWSSGAEELLLGTAAKESGLGTVALRQLGHGPALGVYQMEPTTHDDIWETFLRYRPTLEARVIGLIAHTGLGLPLPVSSHGNLAHQLIWNLAYATAMARLRYLRVSATIPPAHDLEAQAGYWKQHYNTPGGKGTPEEYVAAYRRFVAA